MVRSHWIGPVFGVLALTGLAAGQTTTPLVPASTGDAEGQIITVQEMGKPAQQCKILKTWTEPDGTHAYQAQALDTGELMTIEGGRPSVVPTRDGSVRAATMRIFHWGRRGDALPTDTPMPPQDAVAVTPGIQGRPAPMQPPPLAAAPAPPASADQKLSGRCPARPLPVAKVAPSPYAFQPSTGVVQNKAVMGGSYESGPAVVKVGGSPYAPGSNVAPAMPSAPIAATVPTRTDDGATCNCPQPVVTRVEPVPYAPAPTVGVPAPRSPYMAAMPSTSNVVLGPEIVLPLPDEQKPPTMGSRVPSRPTTHDIVPLPASIAAAAPPRTSTFKFWNPLTWRAAPTSTSTPTAAAAPNTTANAGAKAPADAGHKAPPVVAKVDDKPAQPGDWRESWGKIDSSKSPAAKTDQPVPPPVAAAPTHPNPLPTPTAMTPAKNPGPMPPASDAASPKYPGALPSPTAATAPKYPGALPPPVASLPPLPPPPPSAATLAAAKTELPHAQVGANDPLKDPEKYTKIPRPEGSFGPADGPAKDKTSLLALLTSKQPPPAKDGDKKADAPAKPADPAAKPDVTQAAATSKPAVPLGMKSALAAVAPDATKPGASLTGAKASGAASGPNAAQGLDPNEPNAFSDPKPNASTSPNAFTGPPPPPPPGPQAVALAGNAFVSTEGPQAPGAPTHSALDTGLPTRYLTIPPTYPTPAPAAPRPAGPVASKPAAAVVPAGYRPGSPYDLSPMVAVLRESLYPSQREEAAEQLGAMDWRRQPEVVDILIERAREDPAPTVRAECARSLGRMKANTPPAVETVKFLQSDEDERVRRQAEDAYTALTGAAPKAAEPAGASSPQ